MGGCVGCGRGLDPRDVVCDLGHQPLANALLTEQQLREPERHYPLKALACSSCMLVQLESRPPADVIFTAGYPFFAGQSAGWLAHCQHLADEMIERCKLGPTSRVLDIGSNDGTMLRRFRGRGIPAIGIEPSAEVAQHALMEGLPTIVDWWGSACAKRLSQTAGEPTGKSWKADLVIATNVLAHVDDPHEFLSSVRDILAPEGHAVIEVPHAACTLRYARFDQVYHEHRCYFTLHSLRALVRRAGLFIARADRTGVHGGSLRITCQHFDNGGPDPLIDDHEIGAGLRRIDGYREFAAVPQRAKRAALVYLAPKMPLIGYGASAKGATMLNYLGVGPETVEAVVDTTPAKWGKYLPGSHIPIVHPQYLHEHPGRPILNFCWNWREQSEANIRDANPDAEILYV